MHMPTKNVYVSEADLPLFEQAAELAGALSTAVAAGLRLFVAQRERERKRTQMSTIEVTVDEGPAVVTKRFVGRHVLHFEEREGTRTASYRVYLTARGQYAVYSRTDPDWSALSRSGDTDADAEDPETWSGEWWRAGERTLRVFPGLDAMVGQVPEALCEALASVAEQPAVEELDI